MHVSDEGYLARFEHEVVAVLLWEEMLVHWVIHLTPRLPPTTLAVALQSLAAQVRVEISRRPANLFLRVHGEHRAGGRANTPCQAAPDPLDQRQLRWISIVADACGAMAHVG
jgi:hypothetical protein